MADILSQLPVLTWRGLQAPPYDLVSFAWEHELAARAIPYVDVDQHDNVRRKSAPFKVRLYFCEKVEKGSFTQKWPQWLVAIKFGDADWLNHPLLGPVRARVKHVGGEVRAQIRDGVIVEVDFEETNEDPSTQNADLSSDFSITEECEIADANCATVGVKFPTGKPGGSSIFEAFETIRGQIFSFGVSVTGAIDGLMADVEKMIDEVNFLDSNDALPAHDALVNVWTGLAAYKKQVTAAARATKTTTARTDTTLDAFAKEVRNELKDVMGLNIEALRFPLVKRGTTLVYYA